MSSFFLLITSGSVCLMYFVRITVKAVLQNIMWKTLKLVSVVLVVYSDHVVSGIILCWHFIRANDIWRPVFSL